MSASSSRGAARSPRDTPRRAAAPAPRDLLLEIGVEELPARFCQPALDQLAADLAAALDATRLSHGPIATYGTPRRLAVLARGLAARQADRDTLVKGPPARAAFDATGAPTRAAEGFARGQGVAASDLTIQEDERGAAYVYARKHDAGRVSAEILATILPDIIGALDFPQSMRWGVHDLRFARPIRWILCLFGNERVPFALDGIETSSTTRGHRTLGPAAPVRVPNPKAYLVTLAKAGVVADPTERRDRVWSEAKALAGDLGGAPRHDPDLLDEITWLVEHPLAFVGRFDTAYLDLPADVLVTEMRVHQRYIPLYASAPEGVDSADGASATHAPVRLLPAFVAVRNGGDLNLDTVRHGNEKVLRARLADARFFWDEDRRRPLVSRVDDLRRVVFQERLGSQYDRTARIERLAAIIGESLDLDQHTRALIARTAHLAKCDLATLMVGEFPELQGIMGREYARADGEDAAVATGIAEHYQPRTAADDPPVSLTGIAVGLADRLDTLAGFFAVGLIPGGAGDPFALRRAAAGAIAIILGRGFHVSLASLVDAALAGYTTLDDRTRAAAHAPLRDFLRGRLESALAQRDLRTDVVAAVLDAGADDPGDALARADALQRGLDSPDLAAVAAALKRVANILAKAPPAETTPLSVNDAAAATLIPSEAALWQAFRQLRPAAETALTSGDYPGFYRLATTLKDPIDTFFDQVLVMDPDAVVRRRRLGMLGTIANLLTRPADLQRLTGG